MTKKRYLRRFTWAVRWQLSPDEGRDVLSDYRELVEQSEESTLLQDLGEPFQAARLLRSDRDYRRWLAVFGALMLCMLLPALRLLGVERLWSWSQIDGLPTFLFGAALLLSIFWFRITGAAAGPRPKGLIPSLLGLLAAGAVVALLLLWLADFFQGIIDGMPEVYPSQVGRIAHYLLRGLGTLSVLAGMIGLVKSRMEDRRWLALYILGFTVLFLCMSVYAHLTAMDLDGVHDLGWLWRWYLRMAVLGGAGLLGTGLALC